MSHVYEAQTRGLVVRVSPEYLPEHSDPEAGRWFWAYTIELENRGEDVVQLISRHWVITDARGKVEEVEGLGVVGEQPILNPGEAYRYTSGCALETTSGVMVGTYRMEVDGGWFDAAIPAFSLDLPGLRRTVN
ncbi:Co2+/Mg2+ efflux protein ApaG [Caulobacter sp. 17J80-11]|uniref:Co2+/Mg2+ efflux protein ApaG n=1 Tax=Caulobacter sp. 17J80-11 TaxID=2763502 RepID=UPI001653D328|nr:Co2+/Mg2+ efflux protein ApaG [Caulobacter sp. 17J80-11]MBC6982913.1 Co2+/Mg2+ efflux protein ApaG [Caulobacter sp. 17J80-11]